MWNLPKNFLNDRKKVKSKSKLKKNKIVKKLKNKFIGKMENIIRKKIEKKIKRIKKNKTEEYVTANFTSIVLK